ncbi:phage virion morphogenesis protein [Limisphaera sp. VF-2]|jgi:phage gpG-like protein|uniref:phage virion morphogenesis protein n=1 Tax=Limisphaera sp. VF-2 TaxID=3400418 RepID=UPI0017753CEB|nr:phage virion morphogenesis protein [Limisphaera sp.]
MELQLAVSHALLRTLSGQNLTLAANAAAHAAANAILSLTQATHNPSIGARFRPRPWPPKRDGSPSLLIRTGRMAHSYRVDAWMGGAAITTDAPYAAIHQTGGTVPPHTVPATTYLTRRGTTVHRRSYHHPGATIPARPFLPIQPSGTGWTLTPVARPIVLQHIETALRTLLGT